MIQFTSQHLGLHAALKTNITFYFTGEKLRQEKEPESKTPDQEQQRPEQHEFTPCRTLHKTSSNLSDGQLNFPDLSMSAKDTKMLLCQLDHAQSQLLEYVSEKPSDYELPMPRTSQDMTVSQQTYWDPSLLSAFDGNNLGTISNNLDQGTSLPNMTAMDTARYTNGLNPNVRDDAISITRTPTNLVSVPQTSKPEYQYMTPPKSRKLLSTFATQCLDLDGHGSFLPSSHSSKPQANYSLGFQTLNLRFLPKRPYRPQPDH